MATARDVAKYFLMRSDPDSGDTISNLKLQKLLYYAQGFHLAVFGEALFPEPIVAWRHGPAVRCVYATYAGYSSGGIEPPENFDPTVIPAQSRDLLDEVYTTYGQYSAWRLRDMTHNEAPWCDAWSPDGPEVEITPHAMKEYFSTLVAE
jgi:uncharacterized phage-associated protein